MYILSIKLPLTVTTWTERFLGQSSPRTANQEIQMAWAYWAVLCWWKPNTGRAHSGEASKSPHTQYIYKMQNEARAQCSYCFFKESRLNLGCYYIKCTFIYAFIWLEVWKAILKQLSNLYDILRVHMQPKTPVLTNKELLQTHTPKKISLLHSKVFNIFFLCFKGGG